MSRHTDSRLARGRNGWGKMYVLASHCSEFCGTLTVSPLFARRVLVYIAGDPRRLLRGVIWLIAERLDARKFTQGWDVHGPRALLAGK